MVNLNIVLPSSNAPESKALYDKLHELQSDTGSSPDEQEVLSTFLSGVFNIVAKLEAESAERKDD